MDSAYANTTPNSVSSSSNSSSSSSNISSSNANMSNVLMLKGLDADYDCLKTCVDFMYSGGAKFKIRVNSVGLLKRTASFMELGDLVKICACFEQYFNTNNGTSHHQSRSLLGLANNTDLGMAN